MDGGVGIGKGGQSKAGGASPGSLLGLSDDKKGGSGLDIADSLASDRKNPNLADDDPYQNMETAEDEVRPEFLDIDKKAKEKLKDVKSGVKEGAKKVALTAVEIAAGVPPEALASGEGTLNVEKLSGNIQGLNSGLGGKQDDGKKPKRKGRRKVVAALFFFVALFASVPLMLNPVQMLLVVIGHFDLNFQDSIGLTSSLAVLEKRGEHIVQSALLEGKFPKVFADELAMHGIEVGQVTLAGDFIRTNVYLADLDDINNGEVASNKNDYRLNGGSGELAIRFRDQIIRAADFVAEIESNPELYGEYSEALNIGAKYMYSDTVEEGVYEPLNISRSSFNGWRRTGDRDADQESFNEQLKTVLDDETAAKVNGHDPADPEKDYTIQVEGEADGIVYGVADKTTGEKATEKASQVLNAAISSTEPIRAAKAFSAVEEVWQSARVDGSGPIDEMMYVLDEENEVILNGETVKESTLKNDNFVAAVSRGNYNKDEVANLQRDRILHVTNTNDRDVILDTTIAPTGKKRTNSVLTIGDGSSADRNVLSKAIDPVSIAVSQSNSDLFRGIVGGNRIVEGGSYLRQQIDQVAGGALFSDEEGIMAYYRETDPLLVRRAEAERAIKSPFDISSRNTFLGSIVNNFASSILSNHAAMSNGSSVSLVGVLADLGANSTDGFFRSVMADGPRKDFYSLLGDNCTTVNSTAALEGDLYCSAQNVLSLKYMDYTNSDYDERISERDKTEFLIGMDRKVTPGVKDGDTCERWKENEGNVFKRILNFFYSKLSSITGLYESCFDVPNDVSLGYRNSSSAANSYKEKAELLSAFVQYDTVSSLINGTPSEMSILREKYYKEHPLDQSPEGKLARISGLTKEEARLAINYSNYLIMIANYDPATRYAFGVDLMNAPRAVEFIDGRQVETSVYLAWFSKIEYSDVRNRSFVV